MVGRKTLYRTRRSRPPPSQKAAEGARRARGKLSGRQRQVRPPPGRPDPEVRSGGAESPLMTAVGERGGQTSHSRKPICQWCRADPLKGGPADSGAGRNSSREAGWKDPSRGEEGGIGGAWGRGMSVSSEKRCLWPRPRGSANLPRPSPLQGSGRQAGKWLRDQRRRPAAAAFSWRKARPSRTRVAGLPTTSRHMQVARAMSGWRATKDSRTRAPW